MILPSRQLDAEHIRVLTLAARYVAAAAKGSAMPAGQQRQHPRRPMPVGENRIDGDEKS